jgi:ferric-dicitrate binding protein FerR (iron transport regulator)
MSAPGGTTVTIRCPCGSLRVTGTRERIRRSFAGAILTCAQCAARLVTTGAELTFVEPREPWRSLLSALRCLH